VGIFSGHSVQIELLENVAAVRLDSVETQVQHVRNVLVALALGNELKDFALPRRK